jgi:hypothetical protein
MPRVIAVRPEHLADVLTFKRRSKLVCLEEAIPQMGRWRAKLITLLPEASTAQTRGVVRSER